PSKCCLGMATEHDWYRRRCGPDVHVDKIAEASLGADRCTAPQLAQLRHRFLEARTSLIERNAAGAKFCRMLPADPAPDGETARVIRRDRGQLSCRHDHSS